MTRSWARSGNSTKVSWVAGRRLCLADMAIDASSDPPLITIEGTMELCGDLDIDPENVSSESAHQSDP